MNFDLRVLSDPDTDPDAHQREWRRMFAHFTPRLDDYFAGRVPDVADREDLLQHVWHKAVLHVHTLPNSSVLWNWLRKVGENRMLDLRRSESAAERLLEQHAADLQHELDTKDESDALHSIASNPFDGDLGRRFDLLSETDRKLILLAMDEVPHDEIARQLGLSSADASRQRLHRLRRSLRTR